MKCVNCGKELSPTAKFCTNCGTSVVQYEESISYELPNEISNDKANETSDTNIEKQGNDASIITDLRKKWNDKFTILVIIGAMFIAIIAGLIVKNLKQQENYVDADNYVYEETYEDYDNSKDTYDESEDYYEEDFFENQSEEENLEESQFEVMSQDYILPDSSSRFLSKSDLNGLSAEECRIARNEIYARHGRMFNDEALQEYFESFDWYYPSIQPDDFEETMLNEYEIANRDLIVEYETEQGYR